MKNEAKTEIPNENKVYFEAVSMLCFLLRWYRIAEHLERNSPKDDYCLGLKIGLFNVVDMFCALLEHNGIHVTYEGDASNRIFKIDGVVIDEKLEK